ncbi:MAG: tetratricopeptide repeat protein [Acidobacteria bacterium]|nr:tetratricopeptide repeat protein [Acidobacteriota bacterium]
MSFVFPQPASHLPDGVKKIFSSIESKNFSVVAPQDTYFEAKNFFSGKAALVKPELSFANLMECYKSLPMMPPLTGYKHLKGDLILSKANYPQSQNLRQYDKGYALLWCGADYALFAKESFISENPKLKKLNYYSPYIVLPPDIEHRKLALSEIENILKDEPNFFEGLRDRGRIYLDLKEPQKAVESFEAALKIKKSAQVYNDLGVAFTNLERYDDAMNAYLESMKISPRDLYPRMNYAYAAMTSGKFEEALIVLEDLNRAYPTFYPAYRLHYQVYGRMGEIEKAKDILRKMPKEIMTRDELDLLGEK